MYKKSPKPPARAAAAWGEIHSILWKSPTRPGAWAAARAGAAAGTLGALALAALALGWTAPAPAAARPSARACPGRTPVTVPANPWAPARRQLAPGHPASVRLCRYSGLNEHPATSLAASRLIRSSSTIRTLVRAFNRLPAPVPGTHACPADDGSQIRVLLTYPSGHRVTIAVELSGCGVVTNGDLYRMATAQLTARLLALTR
jgi:hypothetical protein